MQHDVAGFSLQNQTQQMDRIAGKCRSLSFCHKNLKYKFALSLYLKFQLTTSNLKGADVFIKWILSKVHLT